ncbi:MAG: Ig-like domain-containing protein, partial [Isosphaeraceae bacterium]
MTLALLWLALGMTANDLSRVRSVEVIPRELRLDGPERRGQLVVTGTLANGDRIDLTREPNLRFHWSTPELAKVVDAGEVAPIRDGVASLTIAYQGFEAITRVVVSGVDEPEPLEFARDVVPILTRLGCNGGACHGKSSGRTGFHLSLFGSDPSRDFDSLTREARGRRVFPAAPEASLALLKPSASVPHGGGRRLLPDSPEYQTLRRWIAEGSPGPTSNPPQSQSARLVIEPERGTLLPGTTQQLRVVLIDAPRIEVDVTRLTRFESLSPEVAEIDAEGRVRIGARVGEAILSAQYAGHSTVARFAVPRRPSSPGSFPEPRNVVDQWIFARLRALGESPAGPCSDAEFARRVALD